MPNTGSFMGVSATWTVGTIASDDQPTRCRGTISVGRTRQSFSAFLRWSSRNGWTEEVVKALFRKLGVPLKDTTFDAQLGAGDRVRRGGKSHHGEVPPIAPEDSRALEAVQRALAATSSSGSAALRDRQTVGLSPEEADRDITSVDGQYVPGEVDGRPIVERQLRERRGQQKFRNALRRRYGDRCLVTGCPILDVLEAAHISPYRAGDDHNPLNGLLLRTDIHTLFDLNLLGIEPEQLRVTLHPKITAEYRAIAGKKITCSASKRPSDAALKKRYTEFCRRLAQPC